MIKIYLAGPVDNCSEKEQTMWRHVVKQTKSEYTFLDPMHYEVDVVRGKRTINKVIELEKGDIIDCDVLLAYPWKSSSGTAMEIMYAYMLNKDFRRNNKIHIVVVSDKASYLSPWISHHSTIVVPDFHEAFQWIEKNVSAE
jgi:nucleoside 2-deoxyribosyltransferase